MTSARIRHQFFLDADLSERLERVSRHPGTTKSAVIAKAVQDLLDRRGENELDARFRTRLDRMGNQLSRLECDNQILLESLALFIRFVITLNAHTPAPDKATQAVAQERFQKFIEQVGRQIASGKRSLGRGDDKEGGQ